MKTPIEIDENNVWIKETVWNDLMNHGTPVARSSVVAVATETIKRDGAFIIYDDEQGIKLAAHRQSELDELMKKYKTEPNG